MYSKGHFLESGLYFIYIKVVVKRCLMQHLSFLNRVYYAILRGEKVEKRQKNFLLKLFGKKIKQHHYELTINGFPLINTFVFHTNQKYFFTSSAFD